MKHIFLVLVLCLISVQFLLLSAWNKLWHNVQCLHFQISWTKVVFFSYEYIQKWWQYTSMVRQIDFHFKYFYVKFVHSKSTNWSGSTFADFFSVFSSPSDRVTIMTSSISRTWTRPFNNKHLQMQCSSELPFSHIFFFKRRFLHSVL